MKRKNIKKAYDILCVGACVQDVLLEKMEAQDFEKSVHILERAVFTSGGDATNEAVILSRLGNKTALIAKVDKGTAGSSIFLDLNQATGMILKNTLTYLEENQMPIDEMSLEAFHYYFTIK